MLLYIYYFYDTIFYWFFLLLQLYYQIYLKVILFTKYVKNMILLFTTILVNLICHSLQL